MQGKLEPNLIGITCMKGASKNSYVKQSCVKHTGWQKRLQNLLRLLWNPLAHPWDPWRIWHWLQNILSLPAAPLPTSPSPGHHSHKTFVFTSSSAENITLSHLPQEIRALFPLLQGRFSGYTTHKPKNNFHNICSSTKGPNAVLSVPSSVVLHGLCQNWASSPWWKNIFPKVVLSW